MSASASASRGPACCAVRYRYWNSSSIACLSCWFIDDAPPGQPVPSGLPDPPDPTRPALWPGRALPRCQRHNGGMLLAEVASVSREVSGTSARLGKVAALASALGAADPDEAPIVVAYLSGELPQRQIGVGWASLRAAPAPVGAASLTVAQ